VKQPSVLVTGGLSGIGADLCQHFAPHSLGISRRNGYDIGNPDTQTKIAELSLDYDIFVNHAHNGHFAGQTELLYRVFETWEAKNKAGYIINTGSFATYMPQGEFKRYSIIKRALEIANQQCCKKIESGRCSVRMTLLKPGMLDTPESRQKPHWRGGGVTGREIAHMIEFLYNSPFHLLVNEVVLAGILPVDGDVPVNQLT
jgi:NADP-dependent 3-hydroxy acid dehydrogenase YdfG